MMPGVPEKTAPPPPAIENPADFESQVMTLPDGRAMSWTEYGKADGIPAFYLHGAGSSHIEGSVFHAEAKAAGVRLMATDRPGVAGSSLAPEQETVDYDKDVAALADHLGIDKFVVVGQSNGGMFTMAVAHALPNRVLGAVPINSTTPLFGDPEAYEVSSPETRAAYEGMKAYAVQAVDMALAPEGQAAMAKEIPASVEPEIAALFLRHREPVGREEFLHEVELATREWSFDHLDVQVPVVMFSGVDDAGYAYAKVWVTKLPNGELKTFPGGHIGLIAPAARRDIMEAIAALGAATP